MERWFGRFGIPVNDNIPKQIYLSCMENVPWKNKNGTTVIIKSVGKDCFISEDVTFGNNVKLQDRITIHMGSIIGGITLLDENGIIKTDLDVETIIGNDITIFAHSIISGEIHGVVRVEADTIIERGETVFEKNTTPRNGSAGHRGKRNVTIDSYDHQLYNHI